MRSKHARVPQYQISAIVNADDNHTDKAPDEVKVRRTRMATIEIVVKYCVVSTVKQKNIQPGHSDYQVVMRKAFVKMLSKVKAQCR